MKIPVLEEMKAAEAAAFSGKLFHGVQIKFMPDGVIVLVGVKSTPKVVFVNDVAVHVQCGKDGHDQASA